MHAKKIAALVGASVVAVGAALTGSMLAANAAATPFTDIVSVSNHADSGNNGNWALDTFKRTTTITDNNNGTYTATLSDSGTFDATNSPITGDPIADGHATGTMSGTYSFRVTSDTGPSADGVPSSYDDSTANKAPSTESWVAQYFPADATVVSNQDWSWTYDNACQSWTDSVTDTHTGDIDMVCDSAHAFTVEYLCRIPGGSQNVWTVANNTDKPQKFHAAIQYGDTTVWFGWDDRAPLAAHTSNGIVSPHAGTLHVRLAVPDHGDDATAHSDGHYCS